jgi:uncharacterized membrane protein YhaH (DUF805 family)
LILIAWTQVLRKAGYSGWWVLMGFIPVAGLVMFLVFAFSRWPVQDAAERAARLAYAPPQQSLPPNRRR